MNDLISRQAAIEALDEIRHALWEIDIPSPTVPEYVEHHEQVQSVWKLLDKKQKELYVLPSAQPEPCKDVVIRSAIIQKLNTMDRYVSEELRLCDTDKKFPKNEVFIVDDVYEEIVENLPSAQPEIIRCRECKYAEVADKEDTQDGYICQFHRGSIWFSGSYCSWAERRTDE